MTYKYIYIKKLTAALQKAIIKRQYILYATDSFTCSEMPHHISQATFLHFGNEGTKSS